MKHYLGAMAWAAELHGDATPKHWPSPLLAHLVAVSSLAWEDGGDEEQAIGALFHVLPTSLMLPPGVEVSLEVWFGLLALIGWLFSIGLWRQSRLASTVG